MEGNSDDGNAVREAEPAFERGQRAGPSVGREGGDAALRPCWGRSELRGSLGEIPPEFSERAQHRRDGFSGSEWQQIRLGVSHLSHPAASRISSPVKSSFTEPLIGFLGSLERRLRGRLIGKRLLHRVYEGKFFSVLTREKRESDLLF